VYRIFDLGRAGYDEGGEGVGVQTCFEETGFGRSEDGVEFGGHVFAVGW